MRMHESYGVQEFDDDACFLCGANFGSDGSKEHVFPKWLQHEYDLWTKKLDLLNGTTILYKDLTIPCCRKCNSDHLAAVESKISDSVKNGYESAVKISSYTWYLWAAKIFYGILRKELDLVLDRRNPDGTTIVGKPILESFSNLHMFLQGMRGRHQFEGSFPYTVLLLNLHATEISFDFMDDLRNFSLAMKLGEIGLIVSFEDGGLIEETYGRYVHEVAGRKLHPIQFMELYAKVSYQVSLRQRPLSFLTHSHVEGEWKASTTVVGASTPLSEWSQEKFAKVLRFYLRSWLNDESDVKFRAPNLLSTWMVGSDGKVLTLPLEEWERT